MGPLDFILHLMGFVAPAFFLAALMVPVARFLGLDRSSGRSTLKLFAIHFVAGVAALVAGLVWFGNDGKMATYAALVLAEATSQWVAGRAWSR